MSLARLLPTVCLAVFLNLLPADAHDTWLQVNTPVVRSGETVYLDLLLGNHGNEHRDFLLASKVGLEHATLKVYDPSGREYDVKNRLIDTGYTPKEGYWSARFNPVEPGMYLAVHSADQIVNHGRPTRSFRMPRSALWRASCSTRSPRRILVLIACSGILWRSSRKPIR